MGFRHDWVDKARGLGIFLVIYGHNYPFMESYIYSFHIPLFFFISGMFHPMHMDLNAVTKRAQGILVPYFIWAFLLYAFWFFLGRHYGNSVTHNLDPLKNFVGIFYAQGDMQFMDWGIPMWFLPCLFLTFLFFGFIKRIKSQGVQYTVLAILIALGCLYPNYFEFELPWSLDVAWVALAFYAMGHFLKNRLTALDSKKINPLLLFALFSVTLLAFFNSKVDMYRSQYGNEVLFFINGLAGTLFFILLFKKVWVPSALAFLGKNTIPLLALQLRALTLIKLVLIFLGISALSFNEPTKFFLTFVQIFILLPVIYLVNKYIPILNGKVKK